MMFLRDCSLQGGRQGRTNRRRGRQCRAGCEADEPSRWRGDWTLKDRLPAAALQVFQSIAKDVMLRLQNTHQEGSPSAASAAGGGSVQLGGAASKGSAKSGCC